jgi:hypothetical protein
MADNRQISDMLEHLLNNEQDKAEELFHEYVVAKSREIYEGLIESELSEEDKDDEEDEEVDESSEDDSDDAVEENFGEADDQTDDLIGDIEADDEEGEGDEEGEMDDEEEGGDEPASKDDVQDLASAIDELQAAFDQFVAGDEGDDMGADDDMGMKDDFGMGGMDQVEDLETVREYVEKVAPAKMGDNGANAKSIVAGKNDMGGTTANILKGGTEAGVEANKGQLKGSSLLKGNPQDMKTGNINVPGGKAGSAFSKKEPGHGAEKAGAKESGVDATSIIRGSR